MKKLIALSIAALFLAGCAGPGPSDQTAPPDTTLPTLDQLRTPVELLAQALDATSQCGSWTLTFSRTRTQADLVDRQSWTQRACRSGEGYTSLLEGPVETVWICGAFQARQEPDGTLRTDLAQAPLERDQVFAQVRALFPGDLIQALSNCGLVASPSLDGHFTYQVPDLPLDVLADLVADMPPTEDCPQALASGRLLVDPEGRLVGAVLELALEPDHTYTWSLEISGLGDTQVTAPDWVPAQP